MNRLTASILALGLAAAVGTASAQTYGYGSDTYRNGSYQNQGYSQPYPDRYGSTSGAIYDYARVLRVNPVIGSGYAGNNGYASNNANQRCRTERVPVEGGGYYGDDYARDGYYERDGYNRNEGYYGGDGDYRNAGSNTGRTVATVVGGLVGAVVGSKVGGGSARYATSALGSMVGGLAGRQIYDQSVRNRAPQTGMVTVCDQVSSNGYYGSDGRSYGTSNTGSVNAYDVTYEYAGRQFTTRTNYHPGDRIRVRVDVRPE